jgi:secreted trypsin-like serine protease
MKRLLALGLVVAAAGCAPIEDERLGSAEDAIIAGEPASEAQLFGTVALSSVTTLEPFCTGTLIAPTVVVSAAHCLFDDQGPVPISDIEVLAGALDALNATEDHVYSVATAVAHEGYDNAANPGDLGQDDDIAVLTLTEPVVGQSPIPVLANGDTDVHLQAGTPLIITGYGQRDEAASDPNLFGVLYIAQTPYQQRTDFEYLAGGQGSPDTCTGDSGGPSYVDIGGALFLVGATSRSAVPGNPPCGAGGIYTLVSGYDQWLVANSGNAYSGAQSPGGDPSGGGDGDEAGDEDGGCNITAVGPRSGGGLHWLVLAALLGLGRRRRR